MVSNRVAIIAIKLQEASSFEISSMRNSAYESACKLRECKRKSLCLLRLASVLREGKSLLTSAFHSTCCGMTTETMSAFLQQPSESSARRNYLPCM